MHLTIIIQIVTKFLDKKFNQILERNPNTEVDLLPCLLLNSYGGASGFDDVTDCVIMLRRTRVQLLTCSTRGSHVRAECLQAWQLVELQCQSKVY